MSPQQQKDNTNRYKRLYEIALHNCISEAHKRMKLEKERESFIAYLSRRNDICMICKHCYLSFADQPCKNCMRKPGRPEFILDETMCR